MIAAVEPTQAPAESAAPEETRPDVVQQVPLAEIVRSPFNRDRSAERKTEEWKEFVNSIRTHGIVQPLLGRPLPAALDPERKPGTPRIELVIGEGRWLGAREAELRTVPVIVRQLSDREAIELQTIENDKRKDLTPIQQAAKYQQLLEQYKKDGLTAEKAMAELCAKLSKSKSTVYETLRLLELAAPVQAAVNSGTLPASHAGLITKLPAEMQEVVSRAIAPGKELNHHEDNELARVIGWTDYRDEASGLVPFREAKEIVDGLVDDLAKAKQYEAKHAEPFRAKGGKALTFAEAKTTRDDFVSANEYLTEFSGYLEGLLPMAKQKKAELPTQVMRPRDGRPNEPEMVYPKPELIAALKKAGVHTRSNNGSSGSRTNYAAMERKRQEKERQAKAVRAAIIGPIRAAAGKRNAKTPWEMFLAAFAGWGSSMTVCKMRGWKAGYNNAREVLAREGAKLPENQKPGLIADMTIAHAGEQNVSELRKVGAFYGVDVAKLEKEARAKFAPVPAKKKPTAKKVQTPVKKRAPINAAGRKRLAEAMRARWAARRADAKKGSAK